ncbi:PREDICTED: stress response protein NST1-like isoform X2 [Nelumbo nucifera]|uniref:Uncharacterized protein n=2 Tax=Nelumbo nucifera TaxID=4432 RepID=A0A822YJB6_NELNU|nr:PREDICTED: stress response protein NST1-like isoform X2 [Nelumbo nucifera]DAD29468.1 TPA_asm: hypothetical protein HUJ06_030936 [Nelumbo nucifera]
MEGSVEDFGAADSCEIADREESIYRLMISFQENSTTAPPVEFADDSAVPPFPTSTASSVSSFSASASSSSSSVGSEKIREVSDNVINQDDQFLKEAMQIPGEQLSEPSIGICNNIKTKSSRTDAQRERRRLLQRIRRQQMTDEQRRILLERRRQKKLNEQQRESHRVRNRLRHRSLTDEQRKRINEARRRRMQSLTDEQRECINEARRRRRQSLTAEQREHVNEARRKRRQVLHANKEEWEVHNEINGPYQHDGSSLRLQSIVGLNMLEQSRPNEENIAIDAGNILRDEIQTTHVHHDGKAFMVH